MKEMPNDGNGSRENHPKKPEIHHQLGEIQ
jgi:hypothetical protein